MLNLRTAICLLLISLAVSARAQISQGAEYFGKLGSTDFRVSVNDAATSVRFQYFANGLEEGLGTLTANGTATFSTDRNRQVTVRVQGATASGTFLGLGFTATKEADAGPLAGVAGYYFGSLLERSGSSTITHSLVLVVFPSGKITLAVQGTTPDIRNCYATGTMAANGSVTLPISSSYAPLNGDVWRMTFSLQGNVATGPLTSNLLPQNGYDYYVMRTKGTTLINVSTRGTITPSQPMTAGFVVSGERKTVLIRVIGPTLGAFGVTGAHTDPQLTLYSGQTVIARNDNWNENANLADIPSTTTQVGGFALLPGSRDAVLLVQLQAGTYTAQAASVGATSGDALIEVYEVTK